jgi:hypothetical protein
MSEQNVVAFPELDFDALPELAGFSIPPAGHYGLLLTIQAKEINKKTAIEFSYVVAEILEQADPTLPPATIGDKFSVAYFLDNEFGAGKLKRAVTPLKEFFGTSSLSAIAEQCQELEVYGTVSVRGDKKDPEKKYADVTSITVK